VRHERTYFVSVCAFGCLGWCTELDAALPEDELEALQASIRSATAQECAAIVEDIRHGDAQDNLKAVIYCACVAEANGSGALHAAGVGAPLVQLLTCANDSLLFWTMNAVGNMADCEETKTLMASGGAILLLVTILQTGEAEHQALAAYALGRLASDHDGNNVAIVESGGIAHLVNLLRADTDMQKNYAAFALESLATDDHEDNCIAIADEGAIPPLVNLLRIGVGQGKSHAASALGWLASNTQNCSTIAKEGVIPDLVSMIESGSDDQGRRAIVALFFLSGNAANSELMIEGGAIPPLVKSIASGKEDQVEHALVALEHLASYTTQNGKAIVDGGAIDPLKELLRSGDQVEKGAAAHTLGLVGKVSVETRLTIADAEVMELLANLLLTTTGEQKDQAMSAICYLTDEGNGDLSSITKEAIVPELVEILWQKGAEHQFFAATVLGRFAEDASFRTLIGNEGAISPLVKLLRTGNAANKEKAAIALGHLAVGSPTNTMEIKRLGVEVLLAKLRRTGTQKQKRSASKALGYLNEEKVASKRGRR
jgi:HEAT repeat protein